MSNLLNSIEARVFTQQKFRFCESVREFTTNQNMFIDVLIKKFFGKLSEEEQKLLDRKIQNKSLLRSLLEKSVDGTGPKLIPVPSRISLTLQEISKVYFFSFDEFKQCINRINKKFAPDARLTVEPSTEGIFIIFQFLP